MIWIHEFQTVTQRDNYINSSSFRIPFVSLHKNNSENVVTYNPKDVVPKVRIGDACYYDSGESKFAFCDASSYSSSMGEIQGVVIMPDYLAPDNKTRIVSLYGINKDGTVSQSWNNSEVFASYGAAAFDVDMEKYEVVPTWNNSANPSYSENNVGYLPSDYYTGQTCYGVTGAKYNSTSDLVPPPILDNDTRNSNCFATLQDGNALTDFDGKSNCEACTEYAYYDDYSLVYACSCYGTTNLPAGDWYLGSVGEWAFVIQKLNAIENAISILGGTSLQVTDNGYQDFWTSTGSNEQVSGWDWYYGFKVDLANGCVGKVDKTESGHFRPFAIVQ